MQDMIGWLALGIVILAPIADYIWVKTRKNTAVDGVQNESGENK